MFEQAVLSNGPASKRAWATFAGVTGQALLVTIGVMIPMIWPEAIPTHQISRIFIPGVPPGRPPKGEAQAPRHATQAVPRPWRDDAVMMLRRVPDQIRQIEEPPDAGLALGSRVGVPGGSSIDSSDGIFAGLGASTEVLPARPVEDRHVAAETPVPTVAPVTRYKEGGNVKLGKLIHRVEPVYPRLAMMARLSGVVELVGVVGVDGRIRELTVKRGHPMLVPAAIEAVRQWIYEPTTLNGDRVEIEAPITVTFKLN